MTNQENNGNIQGSQNSVPSDSFSIIPKGQEKRQDFYAQLNHFINLGLEMDAAKEARKAIMEQLFESKDVDCKKGDFGKAVRRLEQQHLTDKVRVDQGVNDAVLADYEIAKKHLV